MRISGGVYFFIVSRDAQKLGDFRLLAESHGLLWKALPQACQCFGLGAAREKAAELLASLCFGPWEQRWLADLARRRYDCFSTAELSLLVDKALQLTREDNFCWGLFAGEQRRRCLQAALTEQLYYCPRLDLDGFGRFRMDGYREYLQTLLSIAADEVLCEQEDGEYLRLLSEFMATRPPGGEIHVFLLRQGRYDICTRSKEGLRFVEGGRLYGSEDMLLYALLQLAPQKLCVHAEQPLPPELEHLLRDMFSAQQMQVEVLCSTGLDKQLLR